MANSIVININIRSIRGKLSLVLARNSRFQITSASIGLHVLVEVREAGEDVEVLVAGRGRERFGKLGRAGEGLGRRVALELWTEELVN